MIPNTSSSLPRHYLFLVPESASPSDRDAVAKAAEELKARGYVYIASAEEKTMEDRDNIRYMPLRGDDLPHFNAVSRVTVVRDHHLAWTAQQTYPGARVSVIDPAQTSHEQRSAEWRLAPWRTVHSLRIPVLSRSRAELESLPAA